MLDLYMLVIYIQYLEPTSFHTFLNTIQNSYFPKNVEKHVFITGILVAWIKMRTIRVNSSQEHAMLLRNSY